jgi:hypothetical protein
MDLKDVVGKRDEKAHLGDNKTGLCRMMSEFIEEY